MSLQSVASTSTTIEATLNVILCCLDAIKVKMEPSCRIKPPINSNWMGRSNVEA
jgi:hypothetical protein